MKTQPIFCLLISLLCFNVCFSQNAFYDAIILAKYDPNIIKNKLKIINSAYIPVDESDVKLFELSTDQNSELTEIINFYEDPFNSTKHINTKVLNDLEIAYNLAFEYRFAAQMNLIKKDAKKKINEQTVSEESTTLQKTETSIGSIVGNLTGATFQSKIIDATAQLIAERLQEDLYALGLKKFKEIIDTSKILKLFLPKTREFILNINPYNNLPSFEILQYNVVEDLKNTPQNFLDYLTDNKNPSLIDGFSLEIGILEKLKIGTIIFQKITRGAHPSDLIEFLDANRDNLITEVDLKDAIHFVNQLQSSFRDTNTTKENVAWIDISKLNQLNTLEKQKYFVALIYRATDGLLLTDDEINIFKEKTDYNNLELIQKFKKIRENSVRLLTVLNNLQNLISQINKSNSESFSNYESYLETTYDFFLNLDKFSSDTKIPKDTVKLFKQFSDVMKDVLTLYKSISKGDYGLIFTGSINILNKLYPHNAAAITSIIEPVSKYIIFATDLAGAQSTAQFKSGFSKVVAPPGSYIQKRNQNFSFSISTHPGITYGSENSGDSKWMPTYGLTVPIGFELNTETGSGWSIGALLSIFDIGAVVNYRFGDSQSEDLPSEVKFSQVFSPGASLRIGFPNVPLDFGIGYQFTPKLRKLTIDGVDELKNSDRLFITLGYDLTLIGIK